MKLIYVHKAGTDCVDENTYEFIFSDTTDGIDGEEWDSYPAAGKPSPPKKSYIKSIGKVKTFMTFDLIQDSVLMGVYDAIDGIIAMAWENIDELNEYPKERLKFFFGDSLEDVKALLYSKDLNLEIKDIKK